MKHCNIISHRGANCFAPQNTLPAFEKAVELHVDGFETDVHLTKDEIPVLCHNYTINATSDSKGNITDYTYEELLKFDFGSYFSPAYSKTKIPTVDEFLTLAEQADLKVLNIELKSPKESKESKIVELTIDMVKEHGLLDRLLISSFNPELLVRAKEYEPNCKTGILYSPDKMLGWTISRDAAAFAENIGADALHPHEIFVSKTYVDRAHAHGIMVNPWTVDKPKNIEKMLDAGVDGIITNKPDLVRHLMTIREKQFGG